MFKLLKNCYSCHFRIKYYSADKIFIKGGRWHLQVCLQEQYEHSWRQSGRKNFG
jgi:hypothetical protein